MGKSAIVMAWIVSRLAEAAPAVEVPGLDPRTDTGVSSRGAPKGRLADGQTDGTLAWFQHGIAIAVASDGQVRSPRGGAMRGPALQHADALQSSASTDCT